MKSRRRMSMSLAMRIEIDLSIACPLAREVNDLGEKVAWFRDPFWIVACIRGCLRWFQVEVLGSKSQSAVFEDV